VVILVKQTTIYNVHSIYPTAAFLSDFETCEFSHHKQQSADSMQEIHVAV